MVEEANELRPFTNAARGHDSEPVGTIIGDLEVGVDEAALAADPADEVGREVWIWWREGKQRRGGRGRDMGRR